MYNDAQSKKPPLLQDMLDYRGETVRLLRSAKNIDDMIAASDALSYLLGMGGASPYVCGSYNDRWPGNAYDALRRRTAFYIKDSFWAQPECLRPLWDSMDSAQQESRAFATYCPSSSAEVILVQCLSAKGTLHRDGAFGLTYYQSEIDIAAHQNMRVIDLARMPAELKSLDAPDRSDTELSDIFHAWLAQNKELTAVFNEHGLPTLRTCSIDIWQKLHAQQFVGLTELKQFCQLK
jgi:hypothetical protein